MSRCRLQGRATLTVCTDSEKPVEIIGGVRARSLLFLEVGGPRHVLSGSDDGMIRQYRVDDGVQVGETMKTSSKVAAIDLSADGKWIVSGGERMVNVWCIRSRQIVSTVNEHSAWVDTVHVSPDSTKLVTGSNDKRAFIWDLSTGNLRRLVGPLEHTGRVGAVRFSPDGARIVTCTANGGLRIYDAHNGELLKTIPVSVASYPTPIAWSSATSLFALVSLNTLMHIDVKTEQTFSSWTIPGESVNNFGSIALSSNSKFIAAFVGRAISLWDTSTSARISSDILHPAPICSIALSSDSNHLAISDEKGKITLRNLKDFISNYYLVGQNVVQQPQTRSDDAVQPQFDALYGKLRALELRLGVFFSNPT